METQCPHCGAKNDVPDSHRGKKTICSACNMEFMTGEIWIKDLLSSITNAKDSTKKYPYEQKQLKKELCDEPSGSLIADFFSFRVMIFPQLIKIGFGLYFFLTILTTVRLIASGESIGIDWWTVVAMWILLLVLRIVMEGTILFFRINATLTDIRQLLRDEAKH